MTKKDRPAWARMRAALWPEESAETHAATIDQLLASAAAWSFIAESETRALGFAELALREYANGCESQPVPFLEGIFVEAAFRRQGIGALLIAEIERFCLARGWREIGSDTQIDNLGSQAAHRGWGFCETERVVYFRKILSLLETGEPLEQTRHWPNDS
ncbi:MAG TPA: aminoglycoside 6'-N-acetyltransferase [Methylovirgula sp.]|nr:aminoglycoside 6'-N-acetyltransferase [Methylovirgula sp.]